MGKAFAGIPNINYRKVLNKRYQMINDSPPASFDLHRTATTCGLFLENMRSQ
ncbi:hypothetical protein D3C71_2042310 [compost metagenome]